jgi:hypothetical protein
MRFKDWFLKEDLAAPQANPTAASAALKTAVDTAMQDPNLPKLAAANKLGNNNQNVQRDVVKVAQDAMKKNRPVVNPNTPSVTPVDVANNVLQQIGSKRIGANPTS